MRVLLMNESRRINIVTSNDCTSFSNIWSYLSADIDAITK